MGKVATATATRGNIRPIPPSREATPYVEVSTEMLRFKYVPKVKFDSVIS